MRRARQGGRGRCTAGRAPNPTARAARSLGRHCPSAEAPPPPSSFSPWRPLPRPRPFADRRSSSAHNRVCS
eukprot:11228195-Lingulodinium_polyedra.AAC.1